MIYSLQVCWKLVFVVNLNFTLRENFPLRLWVRSRRGYNSFLPTYSSLSFVISCASAFISFRNLTKKLRHKKNNFLKYSPSLVHWKFFLLPIFFSKFTKKKPFFSPLENFSFISVWNNFLFSPAIFQSSWIFYLQLILFFCWKFFNLVFWIFKFLVNIFQIIFSAAIL